MMIFIQHTSGSQLCCFFIQIHYGVPKIIKTDRDLTFQTKNGAIYASRCRFLFILQL